MTDELTTIQSLLMSDDDHAAGRKRLAAWVAARQHEPTPARELALRELCSHLDVRSHQTRALLSLAGGALVESGLDPSRSRAR